MKPFKIVIVGGGISGLATAYRLCELHKSENLPLEVTVLEAQDRLGGLIRTRRENDVLMEDGPESLMTDKPYALDLIKRLGLEGEIVRTESQNRRSFVFVDGELKPVPEGFYLLHPFGGAVFLKCHSLVLEES